MVQGRRPGDEATYSHGFSILLGSSFMLQCMHVGREVVTNYYCVFHHAVSPKDTQQSTEVINCFQPVEYNLVNTGCSVRQRV